MNVALYFGSFNPIHNGHLFLARYVIDSNLADRLWFVVSPRNPLKAGSELIDEDLRLKMVQLAIADNTDMQASDIEFDMPIPSYTIDTLRKIRKLFPQHTFSLLTGSDNALVFDRWRDYNIILNEVEILVYPRQGYDFDPKHSKFPQMKLLNADFYNISSTEIRKALKTNNINIIKKWLQPQVYNFIRKNKLY